MTSAVRVCSVDDVPEGEARRFAVDGRLVAVVNLGDEGFRAVDAICSHEHYYLDEGRWTWISRRSSVRSTGPPSTSTPASARTLPAIKPVDVFPVTVTDDDVLIEV